MAALLLLLLLPAIARPCALTDARGKQLDAPVQLVGVYSNASSSDGEHESGYTLELWRDKDGPFGMFFVHGPQIGDPARGLISEVEYDQGTGRLKFTAKLSIYREYSLKDAKGQVVNVPASRDLIVFDGRLEPELLKGTTTFRSEIQGKPSEKTISLNLKRNARVEALWQPADLRPKNCAEWVDRAAPVLKIYGPKW